MTIFGNAHSKSVKFYLYCHKLEIRVQNQYKLYFQVVLVMSSPMEEIS